MQTLNEKFIDRLVIQKGDLFLWTVLIFFDYHFSSLHNQEETEPRLDEKNSAARTNLSQVNHIRELSADVGKLFYNPDYSDVKLIVQGVEFSAHKIILAARSEYFR